MLLLACEAAQEPAGSVPVCHWWHSCSRDCAEARAGVACVVHTAAAVLYADAPKELRLGETCSQIAACVTHHNISGSKFLFRCFYWIKGLKLEIFPCEKCLGCKQYCQAESLGLTLKYCN